MTNIRNVDLNLLVAFDVIFDELNVTRAAERLAVTQPTASGMLRRLRIVFDDALFLRRSHGLLPTPLAEEIAGPIKKLLSEAEAILGPRAFDPALAEATFRVCASDYMQQAVVAPLVIELRRLSPKSRVAAMPRSPARLNEQLTSGEADICICAQETVLPEMTVRSLYVEQYVCVGRKQHPVDAEALSLEAMLGCDHLLVDPSGRSFVGPVDLSLTATSRSRRVVATVPTFSDLFRLLQTDDYLAFIPKRLATARNAVLKIFECSLEIPEFEVVAMWHPRFENEPRHQWLRSVLFDIAAVP